MTRAHATSGVAPLRWLGLALAAGCAHAGQVAPRAATARPDSAAVGYGMQHRRQLTTSVGSILVARDDPRAHVARIEELLMGQIPGVEVRRIRGGDLSVRVRGGTPGLDREPLWVIDGIPSPPGISPRVLLGAINPGDVARIDVLRGPAAAIYGSRGGNGVILVTLRGARR